jgi:hypothetical protein
MAKKIDLKPIQEEHVSALLSFLNFMGANPKIDPDKDLIQEDIRQPLVGSVQGANIRVRYIKLEGTNIDGVAYMIEQITQGGGEGGERMSDEWWARCVYWVERDIGRDEKNQKDLEVEIKKKEKGLFKKEIVDFSCVGGRIADELNQDTSLKESLLAELITAQTTGNEAYIWLNPVPAPSDKEIKEYIKARNKEGIDIYSSEDAIKKMRPLGQGVEIHGCATIGRKNEIKPLLLPSKDAFKTYDRIARHIRDFAMY